MFQGYQPRAPYLLTSPSFPPGGGSCSPYLRLREAKSSAQEAPLESRSPPNLPGQDSRALGSPRDCQGLLAEEMSPGLRGPGR